MSTSRRLEFESELENNPELKTEYLIYKAIHSDIRTMSQISEVISDPNIAEAFKLADEAIGEYQQDKESADYLNQSGLAPEEVNDPIEIKNNSKNKVRKIYFYVTSAAAILLIALMFNFFVIETTPAKLFDKYYSPAEMALNNTRGGEENSSSSLNLAYNYYSRGELRKANTELNRLFKEFETNPLSPYLIGLIEIEKKNYHLAIENLSFNLAASDAFYLERQWYLSLCYLKLGDLKNAQSSLIILQQSPNVYQSDAKALLRKIRRLTK